MRGKHLSVVPVGIDQDPFIRLTRDISEHKEINLEKPCALHAKFLLKKAWKSQISVSLPRMRPAASGYVPLPQNIPNDRELVQITCALRMFLSRLAIVVSTRESRKLRDGLMGLGVTQMSAFSSTKPGGYADREESGEQFHIDDGRTPKEFEAALRARGLDPVWKDFDGAFASR